MEELHKLQHLLNNVSSISKKYDDIAKTTGESFNIFSIMNMEWNEVYTHSAIIGELLNPNGSHNFGSIFLDSFLAILNKKFGIEIKPFQKLVDEKICERTISLSNDWEKVSGGRIDIIIEDNKQILIIENKPSAKDQEYQLIRYYNYAKTRGKEFYIIYLTLDGKELADEKEYSNEIGNIITGKNFHYLKRKEYEKFKLENSDSNNHYCLYFPITFRHEILEWLEVCIKLTEKTPLVSEVIKQYRNNVKNITNQNINNEMSNELRSLINEENAESILILANEIEEIKKQTKIKFIDLLKSKISFTKIIENNKTINGVVDENGGFYLGFQFYENNNSISLIEEGKELTEKIKNKFPSIASNEYLLAWYVPKPFQENQVFENLDVKEIVKMYHNDQYLEETVNNIADEFNSIKEYIQELVEKNNV